MSNENSLEYWRTRALRAEKQVADLQSLVQKSEENYKRYEHAAAARFEEACRSFELLIIEQLRKTGPASSNDSFVGATNVSRSTPALSTATDSTVSHPQLVLKPKRAPPVPPGKAFGSPNKSASRYVSKAPSLQYVKN